MEKVSPKDLFLESLERCAMSSGVGERRAMSPTFLQAFYDRFLGSSAEVRQKFSGTDMSVQKQMMIRSLRLSAGATAGDRESLVEIRDRAETHSRGQLDIRPKLYDYWLDALIATAKDFDPKWEPAIESAWRRILGHVVKHMVRQY